MDRAYPDLILGSPLGRQSLAGYLGFGLGGALLEELGIGEVPGTSMLRPRGVRRRRPQRGRGWQEVAPEQARAVIGAAVERGEWRALSQRDELGLLADLAESTFGFGFGGADEAEWGLTALAEQELRPVAEALATAPAAARWREPAALADQRFLEWDDCPRVTGPAVEQAVRDGMRAERAENSEGLRRGRPRERPGTRVGACWWSAPDFAQLTWTTSAVGDIPAIAFGHFFDTLWPFEETGVTVWSLQIAPHANVLEITEPAGWQALGGYLASCGLALPVNGGYTMLAGWVPGATLWLRDLATAACPLGRWHGNPQDLDWGEIRRNWTPGTGEPPASAQPS